MAFLPEDAVRRIYVSYLNQFVIPEMRVATTTMYDYFESDLDRDIREFFGQGKTIADFGIDRVEYRKLSVCMMREEDLLYPELSVSQLDLLARCSIWHEYAYCRGERGETLRTFLDFVYRKLSRFSEDDENTLRAPSSGNLLFYMISLGSKNLQILGW